MTMRYPKPRYWFILFPQHWDVCLDPLCRIVASFNLCSEFLSVVLCVFSCRENKYIPPGQRNRDPMSWGPGRQNSPRLAQSSGGPSAPRPGPHDYSPNSGTDQRVVNGGVFPMSRNNPLPKFACSTPCLCYV